MTNAPARASKLLRNFRPPSNRSFNSSLGNMWGGCLVKYIKTGAPHHATVTPNPSSSTRGPLVDHLSACVSHERRRSSPLIDPSILVRIKSQFFKMPGQVDEPKAKRATFGMGCFWAGDSLFGATPGVIRTCVGYAGGVKPSPTYRSIGDHTEVIDIVYDPAAISYSQLLNLFWNNHEYGLTNKIKRQYTSLILYHEEEQRSTAEKSRAHEQRERGELFVTEIKEFDTFYPAEDYHQKYRLQGHPWLVEALGLTSGEALRTSPLASKLNGYIAGAVTVEQLEKELPSLNLSEKAAQYLRKCVVDNQGNGLYC